MKSLIVAAIALLPLSASADHMDTIQIDLLESCSVEKYLAIVSDFNSQWGTQNGYRAEVAVPIQSQDLESIWWVGRTANTAAFGKAWDTWRDALTDPKSVPAKLQARFDSCSVNVSRTGFDVY